VRTGGPSCTYAAPLVPSGSPHPRLRRTVRPSDEQIVQSASIFKLSQKGWPRMEPKLQGRNALDNALVKSRHGNQ
jgi:hypothetical protein